MKKGELLNEVPNDGKKLTSVNGVEESAGLDPEQVGENRTMVESPNCNKPLNG